MGIIDLSADDDIFRDVIENTDLGRGLSRQLISYHCAGETLGTCDGFALGPTAIEIDRAVAEWRRHVHVLFTDGTLDCSNTAAQLVELAQLLRCDEVFAALQEWAAADMEANA